MPIRKAGCFLCWFSQTHEVSTALCADVLYQISPKSENKYTKDIQTFISIPVVYTVPIFTKLTATEKKIMNISCTNVIEIQLKNVDDTGKIYSCT